MIMKVDIRKEWLNCIMNELWVSIFAMFLLVAICIVPGNEVHAASKPKIQVNFKYVVGKTIKGERRRERKVDRLCPSTTEREEIEKEFIALAEKDFGYLDWSNSSTNEDYEKEWNIIFKIDFRLKSKTGREKAVSGILAQTLGEYSTKPNPDDEVDDHCRIEDPEFADPRVRKVYFFTDMYKGGRGPPYNLDGEFRLNIIDEIKKQYTQFKGLDMLKDNLKEIPLSKDVFVPPGTTAIVVPIALESLRAGNGTFLEVRINYPGDPNATMKLRTHGTWGEYDYVRGYFVESVIYGVDLENPSGGWHPGITDVFKKARKKAVHMFIYQPTLTGNVSSNGSLISGSVGEQ